MVDFGIPDKMIKISGKVDEQTLTMDSAILIFRSRFKKILKKFFLNKERNINFAEFVFSVGLSTFPIIFIVYTHTHIYIYIKHYHF